MELTRGVDPALLAALSGPFNPVMLVYIDWPSSPIRVHSGLGTIIWGGHDWIGVGARGFIELPVEAMGAASFAGKMVLGGLPSEIDEHLTANVRGVDVDVYFGVVTERAGTTLIGTPVSAFIGFADDMSDSETFDDKGSSRTITLAISSGPSQRSQGGSVHTYEDQKVASPGDTAGRWVKAAHANSSAKLPSW